MRLEACKLSYSDRDLSDQELSEYLLVTASGILTPNIIRMYCMHLQDLAKGFPSPQWARLIECSTSVARVMCYCCVYGFSFAPMACCISPEGCALAVALVFCILFVASNRWGLPFAHIVRAITLGLLDDI